jgi:hypothetical protein
MKIQSVFNYMLKRVLIATLVALRQRAQRQMQGRIAASGLRRRRVVRIGQRQRSWHTKHTTLSQG